MARGEAAVKRRPGRPRKFPLPDVSVPLSVPTGCRVEVRSEDGEWLPAAIRTARPWANGAFTAEHRKLGRKPYTHRRKSNVSGDAEDVSTPSWVLVEYDNEDRPTEWVLFTENGAVCTKASDAVGLCVCERHIGAARAGNGDDDDDDEEANAETTDQDKPAEEAEADEGSASSRKRRRAAPVRTKSPNKKRRRSGDETEADLPGANSNTRQTASTREPRPRRASVSSLSSASASRSRKTTPARNRRSRGGAQADNNVDAVNTSRRPSSAPPRSASAKRKRGGSSDRNSQNGRRGEDDAMDDAEDEDEEEDDEEYQVDEASDAGTDEDDDEDEDDDDDDDGDAEDGGRVSATASRRHRRAARRASSVKSKSADEAEADVGEGGSGGETKEAPSAQAGAKGEEGKPQQDDATKSSQGKRGRKSKGGGGGSKGRRSTGDPGQEDGEDLPPLEPDDSIDMEQFYPEKLVALQEAIGIPMARLFREARLRGGQTNSAYCWVRRVNMHRPTIKAVGRILAVWYKHNLERAPEGFVEPPKPDPNQPIPTPKRREAASSSPATAGAGGSSGGNAAAAARTDFGRRNHSGGPLTALSEMPEGVHLSKETGKWEVFLPLTKTTIPVRIAEFALCDDACKCAREAASTIQTHVTQLMVDKTMEEREAKKRRSSSGKRASCHHCAQQQQQQQQLEAGDPIECVTCTRRFHLGCLEKRMIESGFARTSTETADFSCPSCLKAILDATRGKLGLPAEWVVRSETDGGANGRRALRRRSGAHGGHGEGGKSEDGPAELENHFGFPISASFIKSHANPRPRTKNLRRKDGVDFPSNSQWVGDGFVDGSMRSRSRVFYSSFRFLNAPSVEYRLLDHVLLFRISPDGEEEDEEDEEDEDGNSSKAEGGVDHPSSSSKGRQHLESPSSRNMRQSDSSHKAPEFYVGQIEALWEEPQGSRKARIAWFFWPAEAQLSGTKVGEDEVFSSNEVDVVPLSSIAAKARVVSFAEYEEMRKAGTIPSGAAAASQTGMPTPLESPVASGNGNAGGPETWGPDTGGSAGNKSGFSEAGPEPQTPKDRQSSRHSEGRSSHKRGEAGEGDDKKVEIGVLLKARKGPQLRAAKRLLYARHHYHYRASRIVDKPVGEGERDAKGLSPWMHSFLHATCDMPASADLLRPEERGNDVMCDYTLGIADATSDSGLDSCKGIASIDHFLRKAPRCAFCFESLPFLGHVECAVCPGVIICFECFALGRQGLVTVRPKPAEISGQEEGHEKENGARPTATDQGANLEGEDKVDPAGQPDAATNKEDAASDKEDEAAANEEEGDGEGSDAAKKKTTKKTKKKKKEPTTKKTKKKTKKNGSASDAEDEGDEADEDGKVLHRCYHPYRMSQPELDYSNPVLSIAILEWMCESYGLKPPTYELIGIVRGPLPSRETRGPAVRFRYALVIEHARMRLKLKHPKTGTVARVIGSRYGKNAEEAKGIVATDALGVAFGVSNKLNVPVLKSSWKAREALRLVDSLGVNSLAWEPAEEVVGYKSALACAEFFSCYLHPAWAAKSEWGPKLREQAESNEANQRERKRYADNIPDAGDEAANKASKDALEWATKVHQMALRRARAAQRARRGMAFALVEGTTVLASRPDDFGPRVTPQTASILRSGLAPDAVTPEERFLFTDANASPAPTPAQCLVCRRRDRPDSMHMCDGCDVRYHSDCLSPPEPMDRDSTWFCADCVADREYLYDHCSWGESGESLLRLTMTGPNRLCGAAVEKVILEWRDNHAVITAASRKAVDMGYGAIVNPSAQKRSRAPLRSPANSERSEDKRPRKKGRQSGAASVASSAAAKARPAIMPPARLPVLAAPLSLSKEEIMEQVRWVSRHCPTQAAAVRAVNNAMSFAVDMLLQQREALMAIMKANGADPTSMVAVAEPEENYPIVRYMKRFAAAASQKKQLLAQRNAAAATAAAASGPTVNSSSSSAIAGPTPVVPAPASSSAPHVAEPQVAKAPQPGPLNTAEAARGSAAMPPPLVSPSPRAVGAYNVPSSSSAALPSPLVPDTPPGGDTTPTAITAAAAAAAAAVLPLDVSAASDGARSSHASPIHGAPPSQGASASRVLSHDESVAAMELDPPSAAGGGPEIKVEDAAVALKNAGPVPVAAHSQGEQQAKAAPAQPHEQERTRAEQPPAAPVAGGAEHQRSSR